MSAAQQPGNWGRWGAADERGALNRLDQAATLRGLACVKTGEVLSLALPLKAGAGPIAIGRQPMQHFMSRDGGDYAAGLKEPGFGFSDDYIVMATHGTTHIDALAHIFRHGQMWNGHSADLVTSKGARRCGIEKTGPIVTRGIFLDFAAPDGPCQTDGVALMPDQLATAMAAIDVSPQPGDALIVRTGWLARWRAGAATEKRWAGLDVSCAQWVDEQGFSLVCADNLAVEIGPSGNPEDAAPLHVELLRNRGVHFAELFDLEQLATKGRSTCLLVISPLNIQGGVGSPISPVAVL
ncbi:MAG: cyclase family protein [Novosphingobium sp.]|nr:cyclase family protein [Novosphingobium sp.]